MSVKNTSNKINFTLNCNGKLVHVDKPLVMGILNVTPDSFYAGSRTQNIEAAFLKAALMIEQGAAIIDIGGQSTRPASQYLTHEEEWERLAPIVSQIRNQFPHTLISIDTFHHQTAMKAIALGADIINDISGGNITVPYICMHMQGTPQTMQLNPQYDDVVKNVLDELIAKKFQCEDAGIHDIIFDVGFGFGKTMEHNYSLLHHLSVFSTILQKPLLAGLSRKSMIYKKLNITPEESLNGTTVLHTIAVLQGASILRVHDVKEAAEVVNLMM
jgi:dihydropteroate synthase